MTRQTAAIAALVGGALAAVSATFAVGDSDLYWHLATARETLAHGLVRSELFSWTAAGVAVGTDQWLGQLLLYGGYAAGSWLGVLAVRTVAVGFVVGCIAAAAVSRRPGAPVGAVVIALPAILLSRFIWTERPELIGVACFAAFVLLLQLPGPRPLYTIAALLIVWANVHGSFALGAGIVLLVGAHGLVSDPPLRRAYVVAMTAALLSFVLTPAGIGTLAAPGVHLLDPPREIQEWALPDPTTLPGAIWAILFGLVVATAALTGPARPRDVLLVVPLALLSLTAIRHIPLFAIAATPYLAEHVPLATRMVAQLVLGTSTARPGRSPRTAPAWADVLAATVGIAFALAAIVIAPRDPDERGFPVAALASLPSGPGLFAQYDWGGWLIWRAPSTPVFVDGRLGPYRGAVLHDYGAVLEARPGWRDVVERRGVRWILVRPGDPVGVRAVELGWRTLAKSAAFVLIEVPHSSP
jgi:hypothetical protein